MLQSNNLITPEQISQIDDWLCDISYAACSILDGTGIEEAFWSYDEENKE
jgi:hypothetical protein